jgi:uncharacterized protein YaaW (UPF0174 family)
MNIKNSTFPIKKTNPSRYIMPLNDKLFDRLHMAKRPDLLILLEDLKLDLNEYTKLDNNELITIISRELRSAAGNSFVNMGRDDHDFPYKQILIDVADKICPGRFSQTKYQISDSTTSEDIEEYIYKRFNEIVKKHIEKLSSTEKAKLQVEVEKYLKQQGNPNGILITSTFTTIPLSILLATPVVANVLFGGLWTMIFGFSTGQLIVGGLFGGIPIAAAGIVAVAATPNYKKTIRCVIHLINIRFSHDAESKL